MGGKACGQQGMWAARHVGGKACGRQGRWAGKAGGPARQVGRSKDVPALTANIFASSTNSTIKTKLGRQARPSNCLPKGLFTFVTFVGDNTSDIDT